MSGRIRALLVCIAVLALAPATWADGDHPLRDAWNRALKKSAEKASEIENLGKPRVVKRGAKPEIIIKGETITIDGKMVAIGGTLDSWKNALPGTPSCLAGDTQKRLQGLCDWNNLGITLSTSPSNLKLVSGIAIYVNLEPPDPYANLVRTLPNGKPAPPPQKTHPDHAFPGYLELDGYGIDAKTEFWEVRRSVDAKRNLHCGTLDCSHPGGYFSDLASLYLRLNSTSEHGNIYEISISDGYVYEAPPTKK
jgi:hypothetical protein